MFFSFRYKGICLLLNFYWYLTFWCYHEWNLFRFHFPSVCCYYIKIRLAFAFLIPCNRLNSLIISFSRCSVGTVGFSMYMMSSAKKGSSTSPSLIYVPFISHALARISSTNLNRSHEDEHTCLGFDLRRKHSIYVILKYDVNSRLCCRSLYQMKTFPSVLSLPRGLVINRCWILWNAY